MKRQSSGWFRANFIAFTPITFSLHIPAQGKDGYLITSDMNILRWRDEITGNILGRGLSMI